MIWFFQRQHARLHFEVRRQTDSHDYELVMTHPDGHQEVEQFTDALTLLDRMEQLQQTLYADGWQQPADRGLSGRASA
jgi:hypothetical protein